MTQIVRSKVDPFTLEIVKDSLVAIGDEMFIALAKTSMSPIIYEVLDYASGLTDAKGQLLTQGEWCYRIYWDAFRYGKANTQEIRGWKS